MLLVLISDDPMVHGYAAVSATGDKTTGGIVTDINALQGRLSVVLVLPMHPKLSGLACLCNIRADSPITGRVESGDRILAVDNVDVRDMSAEDISKLFLGSKNTKSRRITLLKEIGAGGRTVGESTIDTSLSLVAEDKFCGIATTKPNVADSTVAIQAEIITLCMALHSQEFRGDDV